MRNRQPVVAAHQFRHASKCFARVPKLIGYRVRFVRVGNGISTEGDNRDTGICVGSFVQREYIGMLISMSMDYALNKTKYTRFH